MGWLTSIYLATLVLLWKLSAPYALVAEGQERQYLIPFMWHGPNNQINSLKETLAVGMLLNRTVAIPDLYTHHFTDRGTKPMPSRDLFDIDHLQHNMDTVLLTELQQRWNGTLDTVALFVTVEQYTVRGPAKRMGLLPPKRELWFDSPVSSLKGCSDAALAELRRIMAPHQYVGVQTFHGVVFGSHWLSGPPECKGDRCCEAFKRVCTFLRKSPRIYALAQHFIDKHIGSGKFVSAHVRPYPDPCVKVWINKTLATEEQLLSAMDESCNNKYLYQRLAPSLKYLTDKYRTSKLFIMSHPSVRPMVKAQLEQQGLAPIFMELEHLTEAARATRQPATGAFQDLSFSLLAIVEEAVAAKGVAFVGTKESSMTGTIVQERIAHGVPSKDTYTFYRREGFESKPANLDEFFKYTPLGSATTLRTPAAMKAKVAKMARMHAEVRAQRKRERDTARAREEGQEN